MNISLRIKQIITVSLFVVVLALIYRFRGVLPIFILALFLAYILTPLVVWISSKKVVKKQIPRGIAIIFLYLVIITSVSFGGAYFVINLTNEIQLLVKDIPSYSKNFSENWDPQVEYDLDKGVALLKELATAKFDESVEIAIHLSVDPKKADQMIRGTVALPHWTGKKIRVLVLCKPPKDKEAKDAGADHVGPT